MASIPLMQAIYTEMDRQSLSGQRNTDLLDRMQALLQRGASIEEGEKVVPLFGSHVGQTGEVTGPSASSYQVEFSDGLTETIAPEDFQRDWIGLSST